MLEQQLVNSRLQALNFIKSLLNYTFQFEIDFKNKEETDAVYNFIYDKWNLKFEEKLLTTFDNSTHD